MDLKEYVLDGKASLMHRCLVINSWRNIDEKYLDSIVANEWQIYIYPNLSVKLDKINTNKNINSTDINYIKKHRHIDCYYKSYNSIDGTFTTGEIFDLCIKAYWSMMMDMGNQHDIVNMNKLSLVGFVYDIGKRSVYPNIV